MNNLHLKISDGVLLMEGEEEVLKGTEIKYFELFPETNLQTRLIQENLFLFT